MSVHLASSDLPGTGSNRSLALEPHLDLQEALRPTADSRGPRSPSPSTQADDSQREREMRDVSQDNEPEHRRWRLLTLPAVAILAAAGVYAAFAYSKYLPAPSWKPATGGTTGTAAAPPPAPAPADATHAPPVTEKVATPDASDSADSSMQRERPSNDAGQPTFESAPHAASAETAPHEAFSPPGPAPLAHDGDTAGHELALVHMPDPEEVRVVRRLTPRQDDTLHRAWQALATGRSRDALAIYRQLLIRQPDHTAAQLGEAAALSRAGLSEEAARRYRSILEREPENLLARANLLLLRAAAGEPVLEQEVQSLVSEQPSADLYALLGHVRARNAQWRLAHDAFQAAHHLQPDQADHLFNLGVSLEHLGEPDTALAFYRRAATANGAGLPTSIDPVVIARRIAVLGHERYN